MKNQLAENEKLLSELLKTSPEMYEDLIKRQQVLIDAINKHTNNINEITSYIRNLSYVPLSMIQEQFEFKDEDMEEIYA